MAGLEMAGMQLVYYDRLEQLAAGLARDLAPRIGDPQALFERLTIVVPNGAIQAYLEQELARRLGVTPNIEFAMLRGFFARALPVDAEWKHVRILNQATLHHILVELLGHVDAPWLDDGCSEIHDYLVAVADPLAQERRRYQLAKELSRIFTEYGFSRSAPVDGTTLEEEPLLERWRRLGPEGAVALEGVERWQQVIWWRVFGNGGVLETIEGDKGVRYLTLAEALRRARPEELRLPERFHVVGFSYIARLFVEGLHLLSQRATVYVHGLLPTKAWVTPEEGAATDSAPHPLLEAWGAAGLDLAKMWRPVATTMAHAFDDDARELKDSHLLDALQRDIVHGRADGHKGTATADGSIAFYECPSIRREVEAVASQIWTLLETAPTGTLRPDDIAVVIAGSEQQAYQAQIETVFSNFYALPLRTVELPTPTTSRILEATRLLLKLPFGRFTRRELLRLLVHPNIAGRGSEDDVEAWERWCVQLGIFYGADRDDQIDGYLGIEDDLVAQGYEWDVYNWDQGLRRLTLGTFLSGERSGQERFFRMHRSDYEPLELPTNAAGESARFMTLASSLIADARWLGGGENWGQRTAENWAEIVTTYLKTYLRVTDAADDPYEYVAILRIVASVARDCPVDGPMSFRMFYEFLRDDLEELLITGGTRLCGGVIVSTALSLRAVPFEHVFVVGLGEGQFPNPERQEALDLRFHGEPELGDLTPANRDRYTFLEVLLGARTSLTLSWVARDPTTGEALEASSIVSQLRSTLAERFGVAEEALTTRFPLRRYHEASPRHPEARGEAALLALREALVRADGEGPMQKMPTLEELRREQGDWTRLRDALGLLALPSETTGTGDALRVEVGEDRRQGPRPAPRKIRLRLSQLTQYLESPLQGAARVQLGLREDEEDAYGATREILNASALYKTVHLQEVMHAIVGTGDYAQAPADLYDAMLLPTTPLKTRFPVGYFLGKDRDGHLEILETWQANLGDFGLSGCLRRCGIGVEDPLFEDARPPIVFELERPRAAGPSTGQNTGQNTGHSEESERLVVELTGTTPVRRADGGHYVAFVASKADSEGKKTKYFNRGFILAAAAMAAGLESVDEPVVVDLVNLKTYQTATTTVRNFRRIFKPWSELHPHRAPVDYLKDLSRQLLFGTNDYLLPIDYVAECLKSKGPRSAEAEDLRAWVEEQLDDPHKHPSFINGPIKDYARFGPPTHVTVDAIIRSRFPHLVRRQA